MYIYIHTYSHIVHRHIYTYIYIYVRMFCTYVYVNIYERGFFRVYLTPLWPSFLVIYIILIVSEFK